MRKTNCLLSVFLFVIMAFTLSGCGKSTPKKEADIINDIKSRDSYYQMYNLDIRNATIEKRQTNEDLKTDYVWISLSAENNDFEYYAEYQLTYVLYNDGWLLEDYYRENSNYSAKHIPQPEDIEWIIPDYYYDYSYISEDYNSDNYHTYYYTGETYISDLLRGTYNITISASYHPDSGWELSIREQEAGVEWEMPESWSYQDDEITITASVKGLYYAPEQGRDGEDYILEIEYWCQTPSNSVNSNGVAKYYLGWSGYHGDAYHLGAVYTDWNRGNDPRVDIDIYGKYVELTDIVRHPSGIGFYFNVWDGHDWYREFLNWN